ncbi:PorP/SprF family type IX secretion system membrane protein [Hymenobacter sp. BRD67]|nr:PorP/SprF family type IX secretion system membrane protein [Hymenobacter sp. BRD67]
MKGYLLAVLLSAAAVPALAQQQPQFTHYGLNGMYLNPAYAGIKGQTEVNVIGRYQYLNLGNSFNDENGSPRTGMVSASVPVLALNGGVGLVVYYDQIAVTKMTNATLSYSQHVKLGAGQLGIGVQGIFTFLSKGSYRPNDPTDPFVPESGSDHKFDAGAGLWYESPKFYAGLSANNLFRQTYTLQSAIRDASGKIIGYQNTSQVLGENHAYLTAGYNIEASSSVTVTPTVLVKAVLPGNYDAATKYDNQHNYSVEAGVRATLNDQFWAGLNYRQQESISGLLGYAFGADNRYRIGYAFDFIAFNQAARAFSSHEILLSLRLPKAVLFTRPAIRTPRYSF